MQESVAVNPTLLADPPAAPASEQPSASITDPEPSTNGSGPAGPGAGSTPGLTTPTPEPARACANCGATLDDGQDWCLECGTAVPGSLDGGGPSWRSATTVLGATAVLVLGAAAAAYAALTQPSSHATAPRVVTVAQAPTTTPGTTTPPGTATAPGTATTPSTPNAGTPGTPTTIQPFPGTAVPPKIPLHAPTPKSSGPAVPTSGAGKSPAPGGELGASNPTKTPTKAGGTPTEQKTPILLDTNAASTYNPYGYPASNFGDPRLAIDGETGTAWTALLDPAVAPKMAEGLVIDLNAARRVGSVTLITSTPGMTVQVYGANGHTLPPSITDPTWVALSHAREAKKRTTHITLRDPSKAFRFITLWISRAPASSVGTAAAPGHVTVNELELFAAK